MREHRLLDSDEQRAQARRIRDWQWEFADRIMRQSTVWVCWWNKNGRHDTSKTLPDDLLVLDLITGCELVEWLNSHQDWWIIGEWSDDRYAAPVSLTEAGIEAIKNRHLYDLEYVTGGLVEPGWKTTPAERTAS